MSDIASGDGNGLVAFTDWLFAKNEAKPATARNLRAAVTRVLAIDDDLMTTRVAEFDVDQILSRFENRNQADFTSGSMGTYKSRFRRAVEMYLLYLAGDSSWRSTVKQRNAATRGKRPGRPVEVGAPAVEVDPVAASRVPDSAPSAQSRLVDYQLPLRPGLMIKIQLPVDLTGADAVRISTFVRSLAFEDSGSVNLSGSSSAGGV